MPFTPVQQSSFNQGQGYMQSQNSTGLFSSNGSYPGTGRVGRGQGTYSANPHIGQEAPAFQDQRADMFGSQPQDSRAPQHPQRSPRALSDKSDTGVNSKADEKIIVKEEKDGNEEKRQPSVGGNAEGGAVASGSEGEANQELGASKDAPRVANLNKDKTPMCLVNELARYNKIQHQYRLVEETGMAHKKTFQVMLQLGDESYNSSGSSIKKAQHSAADEALQHTKYTRPPPKVRSFPASGNSSTITPTVELNAVAMKRGELATYTFIEPPNPPQMMGRGPAPVGGYGYQQPYYPNTRGGFEPRGGRFNRFRPPRVPGFPGSYRVVLTISGRDYEGTGATPQGAKHEAAKKALAELKDLPLPETHGKSSEAVEDPSLELKSPISLVHEVALRRNLNVVFDVTRESGPPHMKNFVTKCTVGDVTTEGEGNSKKLSRKRAAELMLEELKKVQPLLPPGGHVSMAIKRRQPLLKKKNRNLVKEVAVTQNNDKNSHLNPISQLIQHTQSKKEKEPVYTVVSEKGLARQPEFVTQVQVGDKTATGAGPNKKAAKKKAAEEMLKILRPGYVPQDTTSTATAPASSVPEMSSGSSRPRQPVPGVLLMPDSVSQVAGAGKVTATEVSEEAKTGKPPASIGTGGKIRPWDQLMYLSQILNFQVQFTDFPKGNKSEFLSLVTLTTQPPKVCHGQGSSIDESHDQAAERLLALLSEAGLDILSSGSTGAPDKHAASVTVSNGVGHA